MSIIIGMSGLGTLAPGALTSQILDCGPLPAGGAIKIESTITGGAPSATANIQGSVDGLNWFNVPYALVASLTTFVVTALTITTAVSTLYLLQGGVFYRYLRVAASSVTDITLAVSATYAE